MCLNVHICKQIYFFLALNKTVQNIRSPNKLQKNLSSHISLLVANGLVSLVECYGSNHECSLFDIFCTAGAVSSPSKVPR